MPDSPLILNTDRGLYCPAGDFYVDAWAAVPRTIVTHAHSDHARRGSSRYLAASDGVNVLRHRMGDDAAIDSIEYSQSLDMNGVRVSLHPAGHLLGSAQVRIEHKGEIWVITGDYKRQADPTCRPFELVPCHTLVTECTFGLPIFRWREPATVIADINEWWRGNAAAGRTSILLAYSLGKAQRVLASVDPTIGPILLHGAVMGMVEAYRQSGVALPPAEHASPENAKAQRGKALVICPPSAVGGTWVRKFGATSIGVASGWMQVRGFRRRGGIDRGFVLSDHVDWPALMQTIDETGAEHVIATHGYTQQLARYLTEQGRSVSVFQTRFSDADEENVPGEGSPNENS
ncbi:MAG TPA: ligase-associated DNA damage response exonuclease [Humisphaera sp.]|nr:ligase-associated DNA damage response exonuclease [Humisphaera sp.]